MEVRVKLCHLSQSNSDSNYIKKLTTLMLKIEDLSNKDAPFFFMDEL